MAFGDRGGTTHGFRAMPGDQLTGGFATYQKPAKPKPIASVNRTAAFKASPKAHASAAVKAHTNPPVVKRATNLPAVRTQPKNQPAPTGKRTTSSSGGGGGGAAGGGQQTGYENIPTNDLFTLLKQQADAENAAQTQLEQAQMARWTSFQNAIMSQLGALPGQVGADYDKAAAQSAALGQASSQMLGQANPDAQVQANLAAIGAPDAQKQQVTQQLQNAFQGAGAVLFQQGSVIPDQALLAEKAAQQAYYRGMGGVVAQRGQDYVQNLNAQSAAQRSKLQSDQDARQIQALQYQQDYTLKQQAADANNAYLQSQMQDKQFGQKVKAAQVQQGWARLTNDQKRIQISKLGSDRNWQGQLARLGISDKALQIRAAELELKSRAKPKGAKQPTGSQVQQAADLAYYGTPDHLDANGAVVKAGVHGISYQTALFSLMNQGVPLAVAQRALNNFYAPGERGRPEQSFQQRQAAKKTKPKRR